MKLSLLWLVPVVILSSSVSQGLAQSSIIIRQLILTHVTSTVQYAPTDDPFTLSVRVNPNSPCNRNIPNIPNYNERESGQRNSYTIDVSNCQLTLVQVNGGNIFLVTNGRNSWLPSSVKVEARTTDNRVFTVVDRPWPNRYWFSRDLNDIRGLPTGAQVNWEWHILQGVTFITNLRPAFQHDRCKNCHAVAVDNFQNDTATITTRGLPITHPVVNATTTCTTCHTNTLLPPLGHINPGWQAAPSSMDFRGKTDVQLCQMARNAGSVAGTPFEHLFGDKLVLWAIGDGRVPGNRTLPLAPPGTIPTWRNLVLDWVNAGKVCS